MYCAPSGLYFDVLSFNDGLHPSLLYYAPSGLYFDVLSFNDGLHPSLMYCAPSGLYFDVLSFNDGLHPSLMYCAPSGLQNALHALYAFLALKGLNTLAQGVSPVNYRKQPPLSPVRVT